MRLHFYASPVNPKPGILVVHGFPGINFKPHAGIVIPDNLQATQSPRLSPAVLKQNTAAPELFPVVGFPFRFHGRFPFFC
jgi:hypothetical protein